MTKILVVDNYDSFVFNLVQYLQQLGAEVVVKRNDEVNAESINGFDGVLLSPGPGTPEDAGACIEIVNAAIEKQKEDTGKDPSEQEKRQIMMRVITDRSYISQWFTDPQVPTASLTKEERKKAYKNVSGTEIPIDSYDEIIFELTSAGNKSITDGDILSEFNKLKSKK